MKLFAIYLAVIACTFQTTALAQDTVRTANPGFNLSRYRILIGTYDLIWGDPNFKFRSFLAGINFRSSGFQKNDKGVKLKSAFEGGVYISPISETEGERRLDYSIHFVPYAKAGPEILLGNKSYVNFNLGLMFPIHKHFYTAVTFAGCNVLQAIETSEGNLVELEFGVQIPFTLMLFRNDGQPSASVIYFSASYSFL